MGLKGRIIRDSGGRTLRELLEEELGPGAIIERAPEPAPASNYVWRTSEDGAVRPHPLTAEDVHPVEPPPGPYRNFPCTRLPLEPDDA